MSQNTKTIRVAMLGARRVGKSSILASMIDQFDAVAAQTGLSLAPDNTTKQILETRLISLKKELNRYAQQYGEKKDEKGMPVDFKLDDAPTSQVDNYTFALNAVDSNNQKKTLADIVFHDIPGENMNDAEKSQEVIDFVSTADVLLIAVDTVHLMEENGAHSSRFNRVSDTDNVIRQSTFLDEEAGSKLVLFVPLKCEKYFYEDRMEEVCAKLEKEYESVIQPLTTQKVQDKITVAVTPILTLGVIEFSRFGRDEDQFVILMGSKDSYGQDFRRPKEVYYKWHGSDPNISPRFCEQPVLYLLSYIVEGYNAANKNTNSDDESIIKWIRRAIFAFLTIIYPPLGIPLWLYELGKSIMSDSKIAQSVGIVRPKTKTSGDGYKIINDPLGIGKNNKKGAQS